MLLILDAMFCAGVLGFFVMLFLAAGAVMVWLTGGGNHQFSGQGSGVFGGVIYNGEQLAPQGVVFVSYNLRLGALGFLAHATLDAERPEKVSGNYGSLDQIAMLQWVKRNIAAFGGDPSRVFLFGTSAGGGNICALMTSPLTRGLIYGVAMQSSVPVGCEMPTLADAKSGTGERVVKALGCDTAADIAGCLRGKTTKEIVAAVPGNFSVLPRLYGPNMDGHVFPEQPIKLISEKRHPTMPMIIGNTSGETAPWADTAGRVTDDASYAAAVDKVFGPTARDRILQLYPASAHASQRAAFAQITTDAEFTCQSRRVAQHGQQQRRHRRPSRKDRPPVAAPFGANRYVELEGLRPRHRRRLRVRRATFGKAAAGLPAAAGCSRAGLVAPLTPTKSPQSPAAHPSSAPAV